MPDGKLALHPISIRDASQYVARWHRHLKPPRGGLFALAAYQGGLEPVGVIIIGRPVGRRSQDGITCEVLRCACLETARNAPSFLYGAAKRAAQALGYKRCLTSTLASESGATMRAIGAKMIGETAGQSWNVPSRKRVDQTAAQLQPKIRWSLFDDQETQ